MSSPSCRKRCSASRTGVRLTPSTSASGPSAMRAPGGKRPCTIISKSCSYARLIRSAPARFDVFCLMECLPFAKASKSSLQARITIQVDQGERQTVRYAVSDDGHGQVATTREKEHAPPAAGQGFLDDAGNALRTMSHAEEHAHRYEADDPASMIRRSCQFPTTSRKSDTSGGVPVSDAIKGVVTLIAKSSIARPATTPLAMARRNRGGRSNPMSRHPSRRNRSDAQPRRSRNGVRLKGTSPFASAIVNATSAKNSPTRRGRSRLGECATLTRRFPCAPPRWVEELLSLYAVPEG